jgi:predicted GTPase
MADKTKVLIMGAAGRDFHNFNTYFRDNEAYEVVAFTATQIPYINDRKYPAELAGKLYPDGIRIYDESEMPELVKKFAVDQVVFAYSDVPYEYVMHRSALVNALGADFRLLGPEHTMVKSTKPVIAVCAVRTGAGKSQTTRKIQTTLRAAGKKVVSIRHPMPYGDLVAQKCMRFATVEDLAKNNCTIEEMEEYEPHVMAGNVIYSGVDYEAIVREAEKEADIILWDGGNNDFSSTSPTSTSPSPTRTVPATASCTTPARSTCVSPTSSSSTRSTPPTPPASRPSSRPCAPSTPRRASSWAPRRSPSTSPSSSRARGSSWSKTAPPSRTAR